jgi:hypothetical protein
MDARACAYGVLVGVWAGSVLVGASDAFAALVYVVRALPSDLANSDSALVPFSYSSSVLCDCDSFGALSHVDSCARDNSDPRAHAFAHASASSLGRDHDHG